MPPALQRHSGVRHGGTVVVLHGAVPPDAPPDEQDVLHEVAAVSAAVERLGFRPVPFALNLDLESASSRLLELRPRLVFNLVESLSGRGRLIHLAPAWLDLLGVPYSGSPTEAVFLTSNKLIAKSMMRAARLPTPPWTARVPSTARGRSVIRLPAIVKSVWEHASVGLGEGSLVHQAGELARRLADPLHTPGDVFAETYVEGREFNLSLVGPAGAPAALPPAEMLFVDFPPDAPRIVGYRAKWDEKSPEYLGTRRSFEFASADAPLLRDLEGLARACWDLFGLRGYARVDFRVDSRGRPWILEVNVNPCISPDSGFVAAATRGKLDYDSLVARIIESSLDPALNNPAESA